MLAFLKNITLTGESITIDCTEISNYKTLTVDNFLLDLGKFVYIAFQKEIGFYSILMPNRFEVWVCYESGRLEPITNTPHSSRFHSKRIERKFWKCNV